MGRGYPEVLCDCLILLETLTGHRPCNSSNGAIMTDDVFFPGVQVLARPLQVSTTPSGV